MQFIVKAYDGAGKLDKRMEVRPRHLAGMQVYCLIKFNNIFQN